jgi:hypothetical protein
MQVSPPLSFIRKDEISDDKTTKGEISRWRSK